MGRAIPFCAARSTGPSHNIGINIQQLMSSMKYRRRMKKQYPAITYNALSPALTYNSTPLSTLASTVTTQARYLKLQKKRFAGFKLSKSSTNQSMIRQYNASLTEPVNPSIDQQLNNSMDVQLMKSNNPQFNQQQLEVLYKNSKKYSAMPRVVEDSYSQLNNCTSSDLADITSGVTLSKCKKRICIPQSNVDLLFMSEDFEKCQQMSKSEVSISKYKTKQDLTTDTNKEEGLQNINCVYPFNDLSKQIQGDYSLQDKEKKLKEVLVQLHDDFERLDRNYEQLVEQVENNDKTGEENKEKMSNKLDELESELIKKEDEIVVIMALCTEVLTLKQRLQYMECLQQKYIECLQNNKTQYHRFSQFTRYRKQRKSRLPI